jgi:ribose 5-phosphate isomerase B
MTRRDGRLRIAFGTDEATPLTDSIKQRLSEGGYDVLVLGENAPWPEIGRGVAEAVADGRADRGVVCCWTGTGVSMAANKVNGARAALCTDAETARGARRWNDANVLALSLRLVAPEVAGEILDAFLTTDADPDEAETISRLS